MDPDDSVPIDDDHRIKSAKRSVTSIAKNRWKILAKALCQCQSKIIVADETPVKESKSDDYMASVRRFTCFNLFQRIPLNDHVHWLTIHTNINDVDYSIVVHEIHQKFTPKDLIGFNNTGNVCVWPSEESLAYFALDNLQMFEHQRILELGGGMTCLVGLFIAKYANANFVHLTDGNELSMQNVEKIVKNNFLNAPMCSVLKWENVDVIEEKDQYDCILSADCLFFDSARSSFINALWHYMKPTLDRFLMEAKTIGFDCDVKKCYNNHIWHKHLEMLKMNIYEEDIHYPVLIEARKANSTTT